jgi:1,2-phenylacetyl-CoA epoxidase catalytic subunit
MSVSTGQLDTTELEERVKRMNEEVALQPEHEFHFETGRALAERLGYPTDDLDQIRADAIETWRENSAYCFVAERAANATQKYGVTSVSLLARRR